MTRRHGRPAATRASRWRPPREAKTHFADVEATFDEFEKLLDARGIEIAPQSVVESAALPIRERRDIKAGERFDAETDYPRRMQEMMGLYDLAKNIVALQGHAAFVQFDGHLRLFAENKTVPGQDVRSSVTDNAANKLFELRVALSAARCTTNLEIEDPHPGYSENPDTLFDFRGAKWGIACTVTSSSRGQTLLERFQEGAEQVRKSSADRGFVLFNLKNVLPLEELVAKVDPRTVNVTAFTSPAGPV